MEVFIKVSGSYVDANGNRVDINSWSDRNEWPFVSTEGHCYNYKGYRYNRNGPDLVAEWEEIEPKENEEGPDKITEMLEERGERYGKFKDHARVSQSLKDAMEQEMGWIRLDFDQREALGMIQHKIARILNGDPNYADSWVDIAGYAKLVADRLNGVER